MTRALHALALGATLLGCASPAALERAVARGDRLEDAFFAAHDAKAELEARLDQLTATNDAMARAIGTLAGDVREADSERTALRQSLAAANESLRLTLEQQGELSEDLQRTRRGLHSAEESLRELRAREAAARRRAETFRSLLTQMRELIEAEQVSVRIRRNRMVVELPEAVLFESGRAEVREPGQRVLERISGVLVRLEDRDFQVAGHTDDVPIHNRRFASNWELSTARALHVAEILRDRGMPAHRISVAGFADTQPVADNDTEAGRAQNRRIEIVLLPRLDELPDLSSLEAE